MIRQDRLVNEFVEMVKIDSPSKKEGKFAAYLQALLQELGLEVVVDEQVGQVVGSDAGNILARLKGNVASAPVILFSAHMDTVAPGEGVEPQIRDGAIFSSGSTVLGGDDKAGIAALVELIRHLKEENRPHGDVEFLFTIGEEIGLWGSRYLDYSLVQAKMGFVLDADGEPGAIICQAPAHDDIYATIYGKASHAGINPEEGVSAIQVAARAINNMNLLRIDEETTANIGVIKGGLATNIVCDKVKIKGEARSLNEEKLQQQITHMLNCLQEACRAMGARLETKIERRYPTFRLDENETVVQLAKQAACNLGLQPQVITSGGGSDANYFNHRGIKTVNLAIGMSKVPKERFIKIDDLVTTTHYVGHSGRSQRNSGVRTWFLMKTVR